jgi:hypothetical protein
MGTVTGEAERDTIGRRAVIATEAAMPKAAVAKR